MADQRPSPLCSRYNRPAAIRRQAAFTGGDGRRLSPGRRCARAGPGGACADREGRHGNGGAAASEGPDHRDAPGLHGHGAFPRVDRDGVLQRLDRLSGSGRDGLRVCGLQYDGGGGAGGAGRRLAPHRAAVRQARPTVDHRRLFGAIGVHELLDYLLAFASRALRSAGGAAGCGGHRAHHPFVVGTVRLSESLPRGPVLLGRPGGGRLGAVAVQGPGHSVAVGVHLPDSRGQPGMSAPRLRGPARQRAAAAVVGHVLVPMEAHRRGGPVLGGLRSVRERVRRRAGHPFGPGLRGGGRGGVSGGVPAPRSAAPVVYLLRRLPASAGVAGAPGGGAALRWRDRQLLRPGCL